MAPEPCKHDIPTSLIGIFPDESPLCLTCRIKYRIDEVIQTQAGLEQCGSIFTYKTKALNTPFGSRQRISHKEWTRCVEWVTMGIYHDLEWPEQLKDEDPDRAQNWVLQLR